MKNHQSFENFLNEGKAVWTGIVITEGKNKLKDLAENYKQDIMDGWKMMANHATIKMGNVPEDYEFKLNDKVELLVTHIGWNDTAIAVKVKGIRTFNKVPHITLAFHPTKGKGGYNSNLITKWKDISNFKISEHIKEGTSSYPADEGKL